jgi:hypothetical protein
VEGSVAEGSVVEGSVVEGSVVEGSVVEGSLVEGSLVEGSLVEGRGDDIDMVGGTVVTDDGTADDEWANTVSLMSVVVSRPPVVALEVSLSCITHALVPAARVGKRSPIDVLMGGCVTGVIFDYLGLHLYVKYLMSGEW